MLPDEAVKEFQELYKKEFNVELPYEEAKIKAEKLVNLFALLLRPSKTEEQEG